MTLGDLQRFGAPPLPPTNGGGVPQRWQPTPAGVKMDGPSALTPHPGFDVLEPLAIIILTLPDTVLDPSQLGHQHASRNLVGQSLANLWLLRSAPASGSTEAISSLLVYAFACGVWRLPRNPTGQRSTLPATTLVFTAPFMVEGI
jgi:hypothetical protein